MPTIQNINSKVNIKKYTTGDIPYNTRQPVIARMAAESTLGQTTISLPFLVDTVNAADSFFVTVNGYGLTPGVNYDYTFSGVDVNGMSSNISLSTPLSAGLNIQAWKLGLKKETEMYQDQRWVGNASYMDKAFQGFVDQSQTLTPTLTTGAPATGYFYSSIPNRPSIPDLTYDLKPRMGTERVMTQQIMLSNDEYGPNGEPVWEVANDDKGLIRFVGTGWYGSTDHGSYVNGNNIGDYAEVTFTGTGLNMLSRCAAAFDLRASVNGGTEGSAILSATPSSIISARNYASNTVINVASGLALGTYTIKLRIATATFPQIMGFEILNESTSIKTNPGIAYNQGKKITTLAQDVTAYNSVVTGTKGGRLVKYQNADGSIGSVFQAVDAASAYLASASHTNEEISRVHHWREFSASRSDDFSPILTSVTTNAAFTLDDGITTLVGSNIRNTGNVGGSDGLEAYITGGFLTFTFIGTGLDIAGYGAVSSDVRQVYVDGVSVGNLTMPASTMNMTWKIASGLPYGSHTVKIVRNAAATGSIGFFKWITYQPKKPSIPYGSVELGDTNVLATFVANTTAGMETIATGVIRKANSREMTYVGTWTALMSPSSYMNGWAFYSSTLNDYIEYTFTGTGFEHRFDNPGTALTLVVALNGSSNLSAYTTSFYGAGVSSFTAATGTVVMSATGSAGNGIRVSGLPFGKYTIRVTHTAGANNYVPLAFDIITPLYSPKSNTAYDQQNTLMVGNNSISDSRKFSPVKEVYNQAKNISQSFGVTSSPTTTSTAMIPMPDMSVTHTNKTGKILIMYSHTSMAMTQAYEVDTQIYVDGTAVGIRKMYQQPGTSGYNATVSDFAFVNVPPGVHKIDVYWCAPAGATAQSWTNARNIIAVEV